MLTSKRSVAVWVLLLSLGAALWPRSGHAADEYVLILLDRSTSMSDAAVSGASSPAFWDNAVAAAQNWLQHDKLSKPGSSRPARAYAVWTFLDDQCSKCPSKMCACANTQKNIKQLWPAQASDCAGPGGSFEAASKMCVLAGDETGDRAYDLLKNKVLGGLAKSNE
jgi:hypothetical protein